MCGPLSCSSLCMSVSLHTGCLHLGFGYVFLFVCLRFCVSLKVVAHILFFSLSLSLFLCLFRFFFSLFPVTCFGLCFSLSPSRPQSLNLFLLLPLGLSPINWSQYITESYFYYWVYFSDGVICSPFLIFKS